MRSVPAASVIALGVASVLHAALAGALLGVAGPPAPLAAAWWVLAAMFLSAELLIVRIPVGSTRQTITTLHLPLILGLAFATPSTILLARLPSALIRILRDRTQHPPRLAADAVGPASSSLVAIAVYHGLLAGSAPAEPPGWVAALAAAACARAVEIAVDRIAEARRGSSFTGRQWAVLLAVSGLCVLATAAGGSAAVVVLSSESHTAWLVLALALPAYIALWAFGRLGRRYEDLNAVFAFTRAIGGSGSLDDSVRAILTEIRLLFGVETACLAVALDVPGEAEILSVGPDPTGLSRRAVPRSRLADALAALAGRGDAVVLDETMLPSMSAASHTLLHAGLAAPISRDGQPAGVLIAGNGIQRRHLDAHQANLFGAIVKHASLTLERSRLIERLTAEIADRRHEALHDALTDLPNRVFFTGEVDRALAEPGEAVAVLFVDLDHFKDVNDTLGHDQGDRLLCEVAARLVASVRPADFIARLGGDEFGVLIRVGSVGDAIGIARRIEESLRRPFQHGGIPIEVGASVGIAIADADVSRAATLLQHADIAMYTAKRSGTFYEIYSPDQQHYSPSRLALAGELRAAIGAGDLDIHFQPQVEIATERVVGVEALARWLHPVRGPISPGEFIPIAEKTGLIRLLTARVLRASLQAAARWSRRGWPLRVSVNLSPRVLHDSGFTATVADLLRMTGMDPAMLGFEVTESTVMHDEPRSRVALEHLNDLGVSLSIDDFGTGYSSLAAIRDLPLGELKVDRSFVIGMEADPGAVAIVSSTIALSHRLGMRVVAEGVETERTLNLLAEMGCDLAQGFHLGRPMPEAQLMQWLDDRHRTRDDAPVVPLHTDTRQRRRISGA